MSPLTRIIRFIRFWHARMGVMAALFFLILSVTGLALNHTGALGLDKHEINTGWLMHWYGLESTVPDHGFLFKNGYLATSEAQWVMSGKVLSESTNTVANVVVGALDWNDIRAIASAEVLYLYSTDGQLVDKITADLLPGHPIRRLGVIQSNLVLKTPSGDFVTKDGLDWQPLIKGEVTWSAQQALPSSIVLNLKAYFLPSLPLERIILDVHSGRIFGKYGPVLMDIAAIVLILLSLSGIWIYLRSHKKKVKP